MIHTIQADFYRLFRSKGFWITEFILFVLMLMGAIFGATGHLMAIQTEGARNSNPWLGRYTSPD